MKWSVTPKPFEPASVGGVGEPDMGHWGCLGPALAIAVVIVLGLFPAIDFSWYLLIPAALLVALGMVANYQISHQHLVTAHKKRVSEKKEALKREAQFLESSSRSRLERGRGAIQKLNSHLQVAEQQLSFAEGEFEARAYGPFWDAVEKAAVEIASYRDGLEDVATEAKYYQKHLAEWSHTFPAWNQAMLPLSTPDEILTRFQGVVRQGQTDFEFSNIFEHRRTREVLIAGFEHLGEAVNGLADAVNSEFRTLRSRMSALEQRSR